MVYPALLRKITDAYKPASGAICDGGALAQGTKYTGLPPILASISLFIISFPQ